MIIATACSAARNTMTIARIIFTPRCALFTRLARRRQARSIFG
jgi:hypothetical protein